MDPIELGSDRLEQADSLGFDLDASDPAITGVGGPADESSSLESVHEPRDVRAALDQSLADVLGPDALGSRGLDDAKQVVLGFGETMLAERTCEVLGEHGSRSHEIQVGLLGRMVEGRRLADLVGQVTRLDVASSTHRMDPVAWTRGPVPRNLPGRSAVFTRRTLRAGRRLAFLRGSIDVASPASNAFTGIVTVFGMPSSYHVAA